MTPLLVLLTWQRRRLLVMRETYSWGVLRGRCFSAFTRLRQLQIGGLKVFLGGRRQRFQVFMGVLWLLLSCPCEYFLGFSNRCLGRRLGNTQAAQVGWRRAGALVTGVAVGGLLCASRAWRRACFSVYFSARRAWRNSKRCLACSALAASICW